MQRLSPNKLLVAFVCLTVLLTLTWVIIALAPPTIYIDVPKSTWEDILALLENCTMWDCQRNYKHLQSCTNPVLACNHCHHKGHRSCCCQSCIFLDLCFVDSLQCNCCTCNCCSPSDEKVLNLQMGLCALEFVENLNWKHMHQYG